MLRSLPKGILSLVLVGLIAANVFVYRAALAPRLLVLSVLEAGKGKAVLVETPSGETLLINAGSDASILRALGSALPFWQRRLDIAILTRPDTKTNGGMPEVLARYNVQLLMRPATEGSRAFEGALGSAPAPRRVLARGDRLELGSGVTVDVLWPPPDAEMNTADGALVLLISYGKTSVLFDPALSPRISKYLDSLSVSSPAPDLVISSSTLPATFTSDGISVVSK